MMFEKGFFTRLKALTLKETRQTIRDPSSVAIGIILPLVLLFIFGAGLSLDLGLTNIAVYNQSPGKIADAITASFQGSAYLNPIQVKNFEEAKKLLDSGEVKGLVVLDSNFSSSLAQGNGKIQVIVNGVDTVSAKSLQRYITQSVQIAMQKLNGNAAASGVEPIPRIWFNTANSSTWYFVPGVIVIVMTLVGAFLTALVIAREWERGTMEMLFSTPVRPDEILLSKTIPYFVIGMIGLALCLAASYWFFEVPMVGSLWVIVVSSVLYLFVCLSIGLLISGTLKNQFFACQVAILVSFLPCVLLSGFVFDLRNVPVVIEYVSRVLPPTYYMEMLRASFLSGDDWHMLIKYWIILAAYCCLFFGLTARTLRKNLENYR